MKAKKPYSKMSAKELAGSTKEFDKPLPPGVARPMNSRERAHWRKATAKRGRPKVGKGAVSVLMSMERGLLDDLDAYAKVAKVGRSKIVADAVKNYITVEREKQLISLRNSIVHEIGAIAHPPIAQLRKLLDIEMDLQDKRRVSPEGVGI